MILAPHILIGSALALRSPNPILGIVLAIMSHYILDHIPHAEYSVAPLKHISYKNIQFALPTMVRIMLDGGIGMGSALVAALFFGYSPILAFIGGIAGILPDGMTALLFAFPNIPYIQTHGKFHQSIHYDKKTARLPYSLKVGAQIIIACFAIAMIAW